MTFGRVHLAILILLGAGLLGLFAFLMKPEPAVAPHPAPEAPKKAPPEEPPPSDPPPGEPVDLLSMVDLSADPVAGIWSREGNALVTPISPFGRLQLPYLPPADYDLKITAERRGGSDSLNVGLSQGDRQFMFIVDGGKGGEYGGLDMVDRKPFFENMTTFRQKMLAPERRCTITCSVRRWGVRVSIDALKVVEWRGSYGSLSLFGDWQIPERRGLFIGSFSSDFRIHAIELIPYGAGGQKLR